MSSERMCFYVLHPSDFYSNFAPEKNPERVAAGLKATVHNPRTSEDAKLAAAQRLDEMGVEIEQRASTHKASENAPATGEFKRGGYTAVDATSDPAQADEGMTFMNMFGMSLNSMHLGIPRQQMGTSLDTSRRVPESKGYAGMDADNFLEDADPETFDNIGRSRGAESGQPGEHRVMGGYRATLKSMYAFAS